MQQSDAVKRLCRLAWEAGAARMLASHRDFAQNQPAFEEWWTAQAQPTPVAYAGPTPCQMCSGTGTRPGVEDGFPRTECEDCGGTGVMPAAYAGPERRVESASAELRVWRPVTSSHTYAWLPDRRKAGGGA